jgi:hypothetical protein
LVVPGNSICSDFLEDEKPEIYVLWLTHNPAKLTYVKTSRIVLTSSNAAKIQTQTPTQVTQGLRWKASSTCGGQNHGCGPTGSRKFYYEPHGYKVVSITSIDYNILHIVDNR